MVCFTPYANQYDKQTNIACLWLSTALDNVTMFCKGLRRLRPSYQWTGSSWLRTVVRPEALRKLKMPELKVCSASSIWGSCQQHACSILHMLVATESAHPVLALKRLLSHTANPQDAELVHLVASAACGPIPCHGPPHTRLPATSS